MEDWKLDFEWLKVRHTVKDAMNKKELPDLQSILYLIGIQELGRWDVESSFTKEEKQDLMHIAVCTLMEEDGFYSFTGRDQDGWPHWKEIKSFEVQGLDNQEAYLKEKVIGYFNALDQLTESVENTNI